MPAAPTREQRPISDDMVREFEIAYLIALYPDRQDFVGSPPGSVHFEAYRQGIRGALAAAPDGLALAHAVAEHFADTDAPLGKMAREFIRKATGP